jgi:hypothetical protein
MTGPGEQNPGSGNLLVSVGVLYGNIPDNPTAPGLGGNFPYIGGLYGRCPSNQLVELSALRRKEGKEDKEKYRIEG